MQRDYAGALTALERSLAATDGRGSIGKASLLLYLLAKNGRTDDARALIATLDRTNAPAIGSFIDWFEAKFDSHASLPATNVAR